MILFIVTNIFDKRYMILIIDNILCLIMIYFLTFICKYTFIMILIRNNLVISEKSCIFANDYNHRKRNER